MKKVVSFLLSLVLVTTSTVTNYCSAENNTYDYYSKCEKSYEETIQRKKAEITLTLMNSDLPKDYRLQLERELELLSQQENALNELRNSKKSNLKKACKNFAVNLCAIAMLFGYLSFVIALDVVEEAAFYKDLYYNATRSLEFFGNNCTSFNSTVC